MKKLLIVLLLALSIASWGKAPKYIFYFIGDGMGPRHLELATSKLSFADFPVKGFLITKPIGDSVTDSAAAGTALATGSKTSNGTIGLNATHSQNVYSVAVAAKEAGKATGVTTTVSIDHATPAAFYAHAASRKMSRLISSWLPLTGLDLYAGAGFLDIGDNFSVFADSLYTIVRGKNALLDGRKIVWIQDEDREPIELPYATQRTATDLSLPVIVEKSTEFLRKKGGDNGFFLMAEGGKIDWASHANNTANAISEVDDLSVAVAIAYEFYKNHPTQTLIIVTADHETGGLRIDDKGNASWTTVDHTSANVPLMAIGMEAERFSGTMQNNEVALKLKALLEEK